MKKSTSENLIKSTVIYLSFPSKRRNIIVVTPASIYYCVISIDPYHGCLSFSGIYGKDMFSTEDEAIKSVSQDETPDMKVRGHSLLGYTTSGKNGVLIIIKSIEPEYKLMMKHTIYKIKEVECIKFDIFYQTKYEISFEKLKNYPFNNNHYSCQTFDISHPFGMETSSIPAINAAVSISLRNLKIKGICPHIIQGIFTVMRIEEFMADALLITRKVHSNTRVFTGVDSFGRPSVEYQVEVAFVSTYGNEFEISSHLIHIGDIPVTTENQKYDEKMEKQIAKLMFEKISNFSGITNVANIMLLNRDNQKQSKLLSRATNSCIFTEENQSSTFMKFEWTNASQNEMQMNVEMFLSGINDKLNEFGFTKMFINDISTKIEAQQKGFFRFLLLESIDNELIALFCILLKIACASGVANTTITKYTDISRFSITYLQLVANFVVKTADSIQAFSYITASNFKKQLSTFVPQLIPSTLYPPFASIIESVEAMNLMQPEQWICASYGPNAYPLNQEINEAILKWEITPISIPTKEGDLTFILTTHVYITELILEISDAAPHIAPTDVTVKGGLYLNRMFTIKENVIIPYTKEKHFSVRIQFTPTPGYNSSSRLIDVEPVRFISLSLHSPLSETVSICGISVYGTVEAPIPFPYNVKNKIRKYDEKKAASTILNPKPHETIFDVIPDSIIYEIDRVNGSHSELEAITKLIQNNIHPDQYDIGLIQVINKPEDVSQKKKHCKICKKTKQCTTCWSCGEYCCQDCIRSFEDKPLCAKCAEQREQLKKSIEQLKLIKDNNNIEENTYLIAHEETLRKISNATQQSCKLHECGKTPKAWMLYEQPRGADKTPFELVFTDDNITYKANSNIIQAVIALEGLCTIQRIEIATNYPLKMVINGTPETTLIFHSPASAIDVKISTKFLDFTLIGEKIEISKIRFYGSHNPFTYKPARYISPLSCPQGAISATYKYPPFMPALSFSVKQNEKNTIHTFTFDDNPTIIGFRFSENWTVLRNVAFEITTATSKAPQINLISAGKHNAKEVDLIFQKPVKQVKMIKIWYLRANEKRTQLLSSAPVPIIYQQN